MALYGKIKAKLVGKPFCTMVVLAAGSSKRMGRDKLMMEVGGVPVLVRSLQAMQTCAAVDELIVVTRTSRLEEIAALRDRPRPRGRFASLSPGVIDTLVQQYREHPGWTAQLHVDNLRAALAGTGLSVPSYPTVRRYLKAQGMFRQAAPKRTSAGAASIAASRSASTCSSR